MGGFKNIAPLSSLVPTPPALEAKGERERASTTSGATMHPGRPPALPTFSAFPSTNGQQQQQQQQHYQLSSSSSSFASEGHPLLFNPAAENRPFVSQQLSSGTRFDRTTTTTTTAENEGRRERYCSGGAWVGPAPAWPTPPQSCSVETCNVEAIKVKFRDCANVLRRRYESMVRANNDGGFSSSSLSIVKKKELEVVSRKIGGLLYLMGNDVEETQSAVTRELGSRLINLVDASHRGDFGRVNNVLLKIGSQHWDEAVYWYPALKLLMK